MNDLARGAYYPTGPETTPISAWHLWLPIFQKLGIDPATIPDFAPPAAPEGEGLPAWQRMRQGAPYNVTTAPSTPPPGPTAGAAWLGGPAAAADRPGGPAAFLPAPPTAPAAKAAPAPAPAATAAWGPLVTGLLAAARTDTPSDIDRYRGLLAFMGNKDAAT